MEREIFDLHRQDKDFQKHFEDWRSLFNKTLSLEWQENWLENGWCAKCRHCCSPQGDDPPFPMALLPNQITSETKNDFYMLNADTAYIGKEGCKSMTPQGCKLTREKKPVACGLFPLVLINGRLYLYLMCPAVLATPLGVFFDLAKKASAMLQKLSKKDLEHLSINLGLPELSAKYADLHCVVFDFQ